MKKLVFAAALALCAAANAEITSSTTVGYQQVPVTPGFVLLTPTFKGVGAGSLSLTDIKIVKADGSASEVMGGVAVQKMDASGTYLSPFAYFEGIGWLGEDDASIGTGEAICVNNTTDDTVYFLVSGEVDVVNKNAVPSGFYLWGNSTPVTIDLSDVKIVKADGTASEINGEVTAQKMDLTGKYSSTDLYTYFEGIGWLGADGVSLAPGESLCVNNTKNETVYLKVPSPIK